MGDVETRIGGTAGEFPTTRGSVLASMKEGARRWLNAGNRLISTSRKRRYAASLPPATGEERGRGHYFGDGAAGVGGLVSSGSTSCSM